MARKFDVAVMHDFYIDRLVYFPSIEGIVKTIGNKALEGGGGVHGIRQEDVRGGNAVNLAHSLARLGLRTLLITHSDAFHRPILDRTFEGLDVELRVKERPTALTVAFEGGVNVMLGHGGGASDFGPGLLDPGDWRALGNSRIVCSVNWSINSRGTELLGALRRRLGPEKPIFMDPADFRDRIPQFRDLLKGMRRRHLADWVSMNEQEGAAAAGLLGIGIGEPGETCRALAAKLGVVFDLHADGASYTSEGTRVKAVKSRPVRAKRLTGAGDVWDAGAIYGRVKGMEEYERLGFANMAARIYLTSERPVPPTADEVLSKLR